MHYLLHVCLFFVFLFLFFFFFKQKTAYEMRISDWSSDVCSSDLVELLVELRDALEAQLRDAGKLEWALEDFAALADRKSVVSGKSVSVRVDLGGRRIIKKKKKREQKKSNQEEK